jgi:hypothetical protein
MLWTSVILFTFLFGTMLYLNFRLIRHSFKNENFLFIFSLSILVSIGLMQFSGLWFLFISGKPITATNSVIILLVLVVLIMCLSYKLVRDTKTNLASKFDLASIAIPSTAVAMASISTFYLGDSGWDSNAYHIPLIGMLMNWGSNNWSHSLSEGTFTIYTPYGVHSAQAFFVSIFSDFRSATIPTGMLFIGGTLLATIFVRKKTSKLVMIFAFSLTPSIFGQLSRNYVDVWSGLYLLSAVLIFALKFNDNFPKALHPKLVLLSVFFLGLAASSKTQLLICSTFILLVMVSIDYFQNKFLEYKLLIEIFLVFLLTSIVPYLRNFIFEKNPIYPITSNFFSSGNLSISELSTVVSTFRPNFWPEQSIIDPVFSVVTPIYVFIILVLSKTGLYFDKNRMDISAFTYDTTLGGPGILSSFLILSAVIILIFRIYKNRKYKLRIKPDIDTVLVVFSLAILLSIPGSWYPRYGMALYLLVLILSIRFLEKYTRTSMLVLLVICTGAPSLYGLIIFQKYDLYSNHRNVYFNPKFGLDSPPQNFYTNCKNLAILEPRPTFTSFVWESGCKKVISLSSKSTSAPDTFFIIANHKLSQSFIGDRQVCVLRTWFDSNTEYGTYLYSPVNFDKPLCNPSNFQSRKSMVSQ